MKNINNLDSREIKQIGRFNIVVEKRTCKDHIFPFSYVATTESASVLPIVDDQILLECQYRYTLDSWEFEIPGGSIDIGEIAVDAAKRELLEETGYVTKHISCLGSYYPSPGITNERAWLFVAYCEKRQETILDPLEHIECVLVSKDQMDQMINEGKIKHSMSIIAWMRYKSSLRGQKYAD